MLAPRLKTTQVLPNQARDNRPQVGAERVLALPLAQDAEIVSPEVDVDLLSQIVDKELGHWRRGKDDGSKEGVVPGDELS